ncbi:MAG: LamG-like jellyroll fold domain-containing protein [Candidatus Hodarchaeota archaeon]
MRTTTKVQLIMAIFILVVFTWTPYLGGVLRLVNPTLENDEIISDVLKDENNQIQVLPINTNDLTTNLGNNRFRTPAVPPSPDFLLGLNYHYPQTGWRGKEWYDGSDETFKGTVEADFRIMSTMGVHVLRWSLNPEGDGRFFDMDADGVYGYRGNAVSRLDWVLNYLCPKYEISLIPVILNHRLAGYYKTQFDDNIDASWRNSLRDLTIRLKNSFPSVKYPYLYAWDPWGEPWGNIVGWDLDFYDPDTETWDTRDLSLTSDILLTFLDAVCVGLKADNSGCRVTIGDGKGALTGERRNGIDYDPYFDAVRDVMDFFNLHMYNSDGTLLTDTEWPKINGEKFPILVGECGTSADQPDKHRQAVYNFVKNAKIEGYIGALPWRFAQKYPLATGEIPRGFVRFYGSDSSSPARVADDDTYWQPCAHVYRMWEDDNYDAVNPGSTNTFRTEFNYDDYNYDQDKLNHIWVDTSASDGTLGYQGDGNVRFEGSTKIVLYADLIVRPKDECWVTLVYSDGLTANIKQKIGVGNYLDVASIGGETFGSPGRWTRTFKLDSRYYDARTDLLGMNIELQIQAQVPGDLILYGAQLTVIEHPLLDLKMDTKSGRTAFDYSGNNYYGTLSGPIWEAGSFLNKEGNCLRFDSATKGYLDLGDHNGFSFTEYAPGSSGNREDKPFSVEFWLKVPTTETGGRICGKYNWAKDAREWVICLENGNIFAYLCHADSSSNRIGRHSSVTVNDGNWHYVVVTYEGYERANGIRLYIDGEYRSGLYDCVGTYLGMSNTDSDLSIGGMESGNEGRFSGTIDEFRLFRKQLSSSEVSNRYSTYTTGLNPIIGTKTVLALRMNEGGGRVAEDSSSNNHNGDLSGPTWMTDDFVGDHLGFNSDSTGFVDFDDRDDFSFTDGQDQAFALELRLKINPNPNGGFIAGKYYCVDERNQREWVLVLEHHYLFIYFCHADSSSARIGRHSYHTECEPIDDGNWHHILVTYDGSQSQTGIKFYEQDLTTSEWRDISGIYDSIGSYQGMSNTDSHLSIGCAEPGRESGFDGLIALFRLYRED